MKNIIFGFLALVTWGCSGGDKASSQGTGVSVDSKDAVQGNATTSTAASAQSYPDWAQAVVPPYPNTVLGFLVNTKDYQFQSADDRDTVAAWYKSHVSGPWASDATTGSLSITTNGVSIGISTMLSGSQLGSKTMITIIHG